MINKQSVRCLQQQIPTAPDDKGAKQSFEVPPQIHVRLYLISSENSNRCIQRKMGLLMLSKTADTKELHLQLVYVLQQHSMRISVLTNHRTLLVFWFFFHPFIVAASSTLSQHNPATYTTAFSGRNVCTSGISFQQQPNHPSESAGKLFSAVPAHSLRASGE